MVIVEVVMEGEGVGVTTSSRHCGVCDEGAGLVVVMGPLRPGRVVGVGVGALGDGATDWKAWMGRASKNS